MIKTISKKKKCKKAKWLSEEALKIAEKRREVKGKGEKERYTHLNAEFQRIPRRDKEAFLSDQWKEMEENNRMEKTRDLFKKIQDMKGTFHTKMGTVKGRNVMDLTDMIWICDNVIWIWICDIVIWIWICELAHTWTRALSISFGQWHGSHTFSINKTRI